MQLNLPPYFLLENERWGSAHGDDYTLLRNAYNDIMELYSKSTDERLVKFNASKGYAADSIIDPHIYTLLFMLHADENVNDENTPETKLEISYNGIDLSNGATPNVNEIPIGPYPNKKIINIFRVTNGSPLISNLPTDTDMKTLSMLLQRSSQHRIRVFARNSNRIDIYTNVWTWDIAHKVTALIPTLFPSLCEKMSDATKEAFKAMALSDAPKFVEIATEWFKTSDYLDQQTKRDFYTFLNKQFTQRKANITTEINSIRAQIESSYTQIRQKTTQLNERITILAGLNTETKITAEEVNELIDFLNLSKAIVKYTITDGVLTLIIRTPLVYTDVDVIKKFYIDRTTHTVDARELLRDIYINETHEILTTSIMKIDLYSNSVAVGDRQLKVEPYFPHPHIMHHNCWGDNRTIIQKALTEGDIQLAISQCIATNMNLNAVDTTVMSGFITRLINDYQNIAVIHDLKTDKYMSFREYCALRRAANTIPDDEDEEDL